MRAQTVTIEITGLRSETFDALVEKAKNIGKTPEEYARDLIEEDISSDERTLDEILAPIRRQVEESGISDEELDELFLQARRVYYREQLERGLIPTSQDHDSKAVS